MLWSSFLNVVAETQVSGFSGHNPKGGISLSHLQLKDTSVIFSLVLPFSYFYESSIFCLKVFIIF